MATDSSASHVLITRWLFNLTADSHYTRSCTWKTMAFHSSSFLACTTRSV